MSPVLGIFASGITNSKLGSYESIQTVTVGAGGASSVSFTSIPSTYKHLQIRGIARANANIAGALIRFNGDTTSNYVFHELNGNGTAASASASTTQTSALGSYITPSTATASIFSGFVIDILDYSSTNKNKTIRTLSGYDNNGSGLVGLTSGLWYATPASITQIDILAQSSNSFVQYSTFALYGIKG